MAIVSIARKEERMNGLIRIEITNQILNCRNFVHSMRRLALKDDGVIDAEEKKVLRKLARATKKYAKELEKLSKD